MTIPQRKRKRKRSVSEDGDARCAKRLCTGGGRREEKDNDTNGSSNCLSWGHEVERKNRDTNGSRSRPWWNHEVKKNNRVTLPLTKTYPIDPWYFVNLPDRPERFPEQYDEKFGEKVSLHYEQERGLELLYHSLRSQRYGEEIANTFRRHRTPEHVREEYRNLIEEREREFYREMEEDSESDDDAANK